ncbi:MAG: cytochrome c, partial [Alphaproteobacteria bacterium]
MALPLKAMLLTLASLLLTGGPASAAPPHPDAPSVSSPAKPEQQGQSPAPLPLRVPIKAVMAFFVDFSAYGVFTAATSEEKLTDKDWLDTGVAAVNLIASTSLISMPGSGPNDAAWVKDSDYRRWSEAMQAQSIDVAQAVHRRDLGQFRSAARKLSDTCQSCHQKFRPELPDGGSTQLAEA